MKPFGDTRALHGYIPRALQDRHSMGVMIPYFEGRVGYGCDQLGHRTSDEDHGALLRSMQKRPLDYFKMF